MKKILTLAVLLGGLSVASFAQENTQDKKAVRRGGKPVAREQRVEKSAEEIAKIRTERLDKTLKFTDKQRQEVYSYNLEQATKHKERLMERKKERQAARSEMKADRERFNKLLTEDQQKIMRERLARRDGAEEGRRGRHFKGRKEGERMHRKIDKAVDPIRESSNS